MLPHSQKTHKTQEAATHFLSLRFFFSCYVKRNTYLSLDQSVCDVPPSCFTGSDDLHYLEQQIQNGSFFKKYYHSAVSISAMQSDKTPADSAVSSLMNESLSCFKRRRIVFVFA